MLLTTLAGGCYGAGDARDGSEASVAELNGTVTFSTFSELCNGTERTQIRQGMYIAHQQVLGTQRQAFQQCLEGAIFSPDEDAGNATLTCRASPGGPAVGAAIALGSGTPVNRNCPSDQVAVGIAGSMSVTAVGSLTLLCADEAKGARQPDVRRRAGDAAHVRQRDARVRATVPARNDDAWALRSHRQPEHR